MPPIYQPEVAAEAIVWAATHNRRHLNVAGPTSVVIWASRFLPRLVDLYLGRTGYDAQQTAEPEDSARPDNLTRPVEGDRGAHGDFDRRAKGRSLQLRITTHRAGLGAAAAVVAAIAATRRHRDS